MLVELAGEGHIEEGVVAAQGEEVDEGQERVGEGCRLAHCHYQVYGRRDSNKGTLNEFKYLLLSGGHVELDCVIV